MRTKDTETRPTAIIIGAGPAGLTAAYELLTRTGIRPVVLEKSEYMGGISRTVAYKGNRIDIGGHRFFSKSDRVMKWWLSMLPLQDAAGPTTIQYHQMQACITGSGHGAADPNKSDRVMLLRPRKSRIYFLRKLFDYPIKLNRKTLMQLGVCRVARIGASYIKSTIFPVKQEQNLEQFLINRFGYELYRTFFKSYTEKVWGVPCSEISAAWGAQRIKGLSLSKTLIHAASKLFNRRKPKDIAQKETETSLIEQFLYPKYGPGQIWEEAARRITELGGTILTSQTAEGLHRDGNRIRAIKIRDLKTAKCRTLEGDYFFSTMPVKDLIAGIDPPAPADVRQISDGLIYRDFITVGLLVSRLKLRESSDKGSKLIRDNWIYVQEPEVLVGRLQIFNNWSPYMVADPETVWLGLEYFCNEKDSLWRSSDDQLIRLGAEELARIGIIDSDDVLDGTVLRMEKTYPAYFGTYDRFDEVRKYVDGFENLFLLGRNGMHRYNNQDHSMLTAMVAVDNILNGETSKANLWEINTEPDYHEDQKESASRVSVKDTVVVGSQS
jgi:protoporphyrinogen oxidase